MYLGIDLGTSGVKALLIDQDQSVLGSATAPLTVSRPHQGWSEQNPADWIEAVKMAVSQLQSAHPQQFSKIRGIGLSGQMHGAVLLDKDDNVLRPAILWNDTRSAAEAAELDQNPIFRSLSGNIVFPGFTAPKIVWVKNNEPEIFAQIRRVLLPKDYLRLWLTGEYISDMSDAAGTSWLNVAQRRWSPELLSATDLDESQMPALVEGSEVAGTLRPALSTLWNMGDKVIVAGGAGDNAASACGVGIISAGSGFVSLGTSGVIFAANDSYAPNPASAVHTFCHAVPNTWHQMGVILSATDALNWYSSLTGQSPAALNAELGDTLKAPSDVSFLPYLSGERTPHNDAAIRGIFTGLSHSNDRSSLTQAVMEGVAFAFRDNLEALKAAGTELTGLTAIGGGSNSRYWLRSIATALNIPVHIPADGDYGAAFGAARLAIIACEQADPASVCTQPKIIETISPDHQLTDAYETAYQRYCAIYPAIKGLNA